MGVLIMSLSMATLVCVSAVVVQRMSHTLCVWSVRGRAGGEGVSRW